MSDIPKPEDDEELLRVKINQETAHMAWKALQVFFAKGQVIALAPELDLVEAALRMSQDDADCIADWAAQGKLAKVTDQQAREWFAADAELWTVVIKPWVLVQDLSPQQNKEHKHAN